MTREERLTQIKREREERKARETRLQEIKASRAAAKEETGVVSSLPSIQKGTDREHLEVNLADTAEQKPRGFSGTRQDNAPGFTGMKSDAEVLDSLRGSLVEANREKNLAFFTGQDYAGKKERYEALLAQVAELDSKVKAQEPATEEGGFLSDYFKDIKFLPDSWEGLGRGLAYNAERAAAGALGFGEGITDMLGTAFYKGVEGLASGFGLAPNAVSKWAGEAAEGFLNNSVTDRYNESIRLRYNPTVGEEKWGGLTQGTADVLASLATGKVAANAIKGGAQIMDDAAKAAREANIVKGGFGLSASGRGAKEAYDEGATTGQALTYGAASGMAEVLIESLAGGIPGMGDGKLSQIVKKVVDNPVVNGLLDVLGEGGEEALSAVISPFLKRAVYDADAEMASWEEIGESAVLGALTSLGLQGLSVPGAVSSVVSRAKADAEYRRQLTDAIRSAAAQQNTNEVDTTPAAAEQNVNEPTRLTNSQVERMIRDEATMQEMGIDTNGKTMSQLRTEVRARMAAQEQGAVERSAETDVQTPAEETASTANPAASEAETRSRMNMGEVATAVLGENGAKAFRSTYNSDMASRVDAESAATGFNTVYKAALDGRTMTAEERAQTASLPEGMRMAAESSARLDRQRASQAKYFGENAGVVRDNGFKQMHLSSKTVRTLDAAAKVAGVQVQFAEDVEGVEASYQNGVIRISTKSKDPVTTLFTHEIVHRIRETSPQSYNTMAEFVQKYMSETAKTVNAVAYASAYETSDVSFYTEEMVADAFGTILRDGKAMELFVQDNRTVAQKVLDAIRDFVNAIKRAMNHQNVELSAEQRKAFRDLESQLSEMEKVMESALKSVPAVQKENTTNAIDLQQRETRLAAQRAASHGSASTDRATQPSPSVKPESGAEVVGDSVVRNSRRTWDNTDKNRLIRDLVNAGFEQDEVRKWISDVDSISAIIAADANRLDYTAAPHQKMLKNNAEYVTTLDASTLCSKRLLYQGTYDAIQHRLPNTALTPDDVIAIRKMMDEAGHEVPCGICYVESRRKSLGKFAGEWLEGYKGDYIPKLEDVTTTDGLERLRVEHPDTYSDFIKAMNKKGTVNPKVVELRTEYREDIRNLTKGQVAKEVRIGGQRIQSFSDFETVHLIDMMQAVMDMAHVGLTAQAYTKVPNFAAVFGGTGIKINLSLIGDIDADGNLTFNPKEGMPVGQAMRLRNMYPENVGTILVGKNDAHILAAMADDRVDFIIPFHRSGWGSKEYEQLGLTGYEDYTKQQNEKMLDGSPTGGNLYPIDYWDYSRSGKENAEIYLSLCAEQGRIPKFSKFLVDNGDGSWSLQPDGSTDGYWKTLIDFKMYDNNGVGAPQQKVKPNFNMDEAYRVMSEYAGDADRLPVANDVVERFVSEYKEAHLDTKYSKRIDPETRREAEEAVARYVEQYGAIPPGENPARVIEIPRRTERGNKVSQTVRTILEAGATPDEMVPDIEKLVADGKLSYNPISDEFAVNEATAIIDRDGWDQAQRDWFKAMGKGVVSKANTTMGWLLYNNAANSGNAKLALDILNEMVKSQRSAAQALQATRILKTLSPETQLYGAQKSVESMTAELKKRYGDDIPDLEIDPALAEKFLNARTDKGRAEAMHEIYRDIGRQMPSRFIDKFNAWRYLSMLGNPRTHVRNIVGNAGFAPVVAAKNLTATAIERVVLRNSDSRTKSVAFATKEGRALLKAAWADYANVTESMPDGKYSDLKNANRYIEEGRVIFGRGEGKTAFGRVLSNTAGKMTEKVRRFNSGALAHEDMWFAKPHYASALAQYCKAHGITVEELQKGTSKRVGVARNYAMREAQKATYQDANEFSEFFSRLGRNPSNKKTSKAMNALVEGVLPFRKTPANILVRSVEYSPLGLVRGLKNVIWTDVSKGKVTASEAIDRISSGLTGTSLLGLGVWLAAEGLVRGHGDDEKDKEKGFTELQGHQGYALELPDGTSITLDWLAPEALPFFIGVNLWEMTSGMQDAPKMGDILGAVSNVSEPLLEMSCLQGLNDLLDSVGYASSEGLASLPQVLISSATSLLTQMVPTLLGQIERTGESVRMTTYTDKNKFLDSDTQYFLGRVTSRIPGIDYSQIPYIDAWGREEASGGLFERAFNNFLNPAYMSEVRTSAMEQELERLYASVGETELLPSRAPKSFTVEGADIDLTAEQYVEYATFRGQRAYDLLTELTESRRYSGLDDKLKASAVKKCYSVANEEAKALVSEFSLGKFHQSMNKAEAAGISGADYIVFYVTVSELKQDQVRAWLAKSGMTLKQQEVLWSTKYSSSF